MPIMTECPSCKHKNFDFVDNFCTVCGNDLQPHKTTLPCCGKSGLLDHAFKYCPFCGKRQ